MERTKETWQQTILKALERAGAYTLMLQWSDLQWPKEVYRKRKVSKLPIKRCTSNITRTQVMYTKGWSEGRKRPGERLKIAAKKASIVTSGKAPAAVNKQGQKRKASEVIHLQPEEHDAYFLSGVNEIRSTQLIEQDHEVAVRVPRYVVSELDQSKEGDQDLDWILGVVQMSYIEEHSSARMYDVLFDDGIRKCIPSGFTEQLHMHANESLQPKQNFEPTCNISSDNESEDEDGSRDGDESWPVESEDDIEEQSYEWDSWAQTLLSKSKPVIIQNNARAVRSTKHAKTSTESQYVDTEKQAAEGPLQQGIMQQGFERTGVQKRQRPPNRGSYEQGTEERSRGAVTEEAGARRDSAMTDHGDQRRLAR